MRLIQSDGTARTVTEVVVHPFRGSIPVAFDDGGREHLPVNTLVEVEDKQGCGNRWKYGKDVCVREKGHIGPHRTTETEEAHTYRWFDSEGTPAE
jgi:hypothetical protein